MNNKVTNLQSVQNSAFKVLSTNADKTLNTQLRLSETKNIKSVIIDSVCELEIIQALFLLLGKVDEVVLPPPEILSEVVTLKVANDKSSCYSDIKRNKINVVSGSSIIDEYDTRIVIFTSGTSGKPKPVSHTLNSLLSNAGVTKKKLRWGLTYQLQRMAGLQVFLNALVQGHELVLPNRGDVDICNGFKRFEVNALSATPSFYRIALASESFLKLNLRQVSLGGEIAEQSILNHLSSKFPNAQITHIYASSEAGVILSVKDCLEGVPKDNVDCERFEILDSGELIVRIGNRKINTGDLVKLKGDRYYFLGKVENQINIGGNKVLAETIETVILSCDLVKACVVRSKQDRFLGQVPIALIELNDNCDANAAKIAIRKHCSNKLPRYAIPVNMKFGEIKLTDAGKSNRNYE